MKRTGSLATVALFTLLACAGGGEAGEDMSTDSLAGTPAAADPDLSPGGTATDLPVGYSVRFDRPGADPAEFQVSQEDGALQVQTGPAGVLYEETRAVTQGDYTVSATFTEVGAPANHREAFGLVIGGSDLQGEGQRYTYFLVRADGSYLIKRREGGQTFDVSPNGWNPSDAVRGAEQAGDVTNELTVQVRGDQVHFLVNGTEVATHPAAAIDAYGIPGVRINHNLNVRVEDFDVSAGE